MISTIVVGILWSIIFSPYGPIADTANHYLQAHIRQKFQEFFRLPVGFQTPMS